MAPRHLHSVRQACTLPPECRGEEHIECVLDFVKDVAFFSKLSELQQRCLCRTMTYEHCARGDVIFNVGDRGDKFYIILSGGVSVLVPSQGSANNDALASYDPACSNKRTFETALFLEKGMGFGELALQSDQPRSATVNATEATEFLIITRESYEKFAGELHRQFVEQRVVFLRRCPIFEEALRNGWISTHDIGAMANCLNETCLSGNTLYCRQGDMVDRMIFVRSGQLRMIRCVDPEPGSTRAGSPAQKQDPSSSSKRASTRAKSLGYPAERMVAPLSSDFKPDSSEGLTMALRFAKMMLDAKKSERLRRLRELTGEDFRGPIDYSRAAVERAKAARRESKGGDHWDAVRTATKQAIHICGLLDPEKSPMKPRDTSKERAGSKHIPDVAAPRKAANPRHLQPRQPIAPRSRTPTPSPSSAASKTPSPSSASSKRRRRLLLQVGTIGPFQYFGDKQLCAGESYPVSLLCDSTAEIYTMSKNDVLRRLPKKLLITLFGGIEGPRFSDAQLLEMHRQTKRWDAFRRGMHGEALYHRSTAGPLRLRDTGVTRSRVDVASNLAFLGIKDCRTVARHTQLPALDRGLALTHKEERQFSDPSAGFLRRLDAVRRDLGHSGAPEEEGDPDAQDPMHLRFEQYWSQLREDPLGIALDAVLNREDTLPAELGAPGAGTGDPPDESILPPVRTKSKRHTTKRRPSIKAVTGGTTREAVTGGTTRVETPRITARLQPFTTSMSDDTPRSTPLRLPLISHVD